MLFKHMPNLKSCSKNVKLKQFLIEKGTCGNYSFRIVTLEGYTDRSTITGDVARRHR